MGSKCSDRIGRVNLIGRIKSNTPVRENLKKMLTRKCVNVVCTSVKGLLTASNTIRLTRRTKSQKSLPMEKLSAMGSNQPQTNLKLCGKSRGMKSCVW